MQTTVSSVKRDIFHSLARGLALVLVAASFLMPAARADEVVERVERAVWEALERRGSAELVAVEGEVEGLPDDPLAEALARAILEQARGRERGALGALVAALRAEQEPLGPERVPLAAAALLRVLEIGPDAEARRLIAAAEQPIVELAHAALLASEGRCAAAMAVFDRVGRRPSESTGAALLGSSTLAACGRPGDALARLAAVREDDERLPFRVALAVGETLLRTGDAASSALWCRRALEDAPPFAPLRHRASACAAAADAERGLLPGARLAWVEARRAEFQDAAVPLERRVEAGLSAAWVSLGSDDPADVRSALTLLDEIEVLGPGRNDAVAAELLRALGLARLEEQGEAERLLRRFDGATRRTQQLDALGTLIEARVALISGDTSLALALARDARALGERAAAPALLASAHALEAEIRGRREDLGGMEESALAALAAWPREGALAGGAFADPALPRRVLENAIEARLEVVSTAELSAAEAALLADRLRRKAAGGDAELVPRLGELRRQLANRNALLIYFQLGERASHAFLVGPTSSSALALPAGSVLAEEMDLRGQQPDVDLAAAAQLLSGLIGSLPADSTLVVVPDGILARLPWSAVRGVSSSGVRGLETISSTVVSASALALAQPPRAAQVVGERLGAPSLVVVGTKAPEWLGRLGANPFRPRFESVGHVDLEGLVSFGALGPLEEGQGVLHVTLPLLAGGEPRWGALFVGPGGEALEAARLLGPAGADLVLLAPRNGWATTRESAIAAAGGLLEAGARSVIVALVPRGTEDQERAVLFEGLYGELAAGESFGEAASGSLEGWLSAEELFLTLVSDGNFSLPGAGRRDWLFWGLIGAALVVVIVPILLATRRKKDPFDREPPELEDETA